MHDNLAIDGTGHDDSGVASKGSDRDTLRGEIAKVTGSRPDDSYPDTWERKHKRPLDPHGHDLDPVRDIIEVYLYERAGTLVAEAVANPVRFEPLP